MVPGTSVFLSSETGMSGNFEIASRVPSTVSLPDSVPDAGVLKELW